MGLSCIALFARSVVLRQAQDERIGNLAQAERIAVDCGAGECSANVRITTDREVMAIAIVVCKR